MKAYPKYKDSGVPWLEHVPAHWEFKRSKSVFRTIDVRSAEGQEELLSVSEKNGVALRKNTNVTMFQAASYAGYKLCWPNDLVINSLWAWMTGLGFSKYHGIISTAYSVFRIWNQGKFDSDYGNYLLRSKTYNWEFRVRSKGIWRSRYQLADDSFLSMPLLIPPLNEQQQISRYLDWQTSKINKFIKAKKRLIELLKEQKQNVINQAVTRGLNPNVKFKPSGVEWIGDIPEHWEARKLKFASKMIAGGATPASGQSELWDGDVVWVTPQDVSKNERLSSSARKLTSAGFASCSTVMVPPGSVVVTSRAPVGNVSFAEVELCTNQGCKAVVPDQRYLLNEYCFVLLKVMQPVFQRAANGTTFFEISTWAFENIKAPLPPTSEQEAILAQIKEATSKIDQAIIRAQREIELMREYRTRLISDVVTGQVDVRNMKCEGGSLNEDEFEDIEEVEEEIELPEGGEDDE